MSKNTLEDRIAELEMRLAFQDDVINTLSEQVARQEMDIRELWDAKKTLHKQLKDISPSNIRPEEQEVPPPHY
ncbi:MULTISPECIES: SlyX family protein [Marinobacter]|jgi:SlyX protein|uniref:Protein SlyX homolog n=1 Tax=Marinobacter vinifirmus TaxID=355591 RepID=A0A259W2A0_9GAMM|nr:MULTISPECIES: SlyX family protein [Marinobacter]ERP90193.1 phi X174 lysis protein [Marinobacter sp. ES-1]KRW83303.1 SlyX protein [Marinobacter sp. P4B1]MCE0761073.1 SlyX family protein [Marinobacter sp. G11]OZC36716.1 SlyX protein [Marinobacter vinifirmus]TVT35734.1 MAG: SlyX family protein [Marinobacter vinifirmus]|tara:strand:- start:174 stop:392 length:219 start_codon:yes stop_codon:yes gene_type:complete